MGRGQAFPKKTAAPTPAPYTVLDLKTGEVLAAAADFGAARYMAWAVMRQRKLDPDEAVELMAIRERKPGRGRRAVHRLSIMDLVAVSLEIKMAREQGIEPYVTVDVPTKDIG